MIIVFFIIINIYLFLACSVFSMPSEMKKETVCFILPGLTWNSTISDVTDCLGKPVEAGDYNGITETVTYKYKTEYDNHPVTVYVTKNAFKITDITCINKVHNYSFVFECADINEEKSCFKKLSEELIKNKISNELFEYEETENEFYAKIWYGSVGITYNIERDGEDNENKIYLRALAQY